MAQAFQELEFEIESCPDIFSALEKVTGQSFDIILADLDQGPEAGFLLKTARELKLNKSAFAFAVATGTAYANPQEFGVELVLAKPIVPNQVKYALLSCDGFLAGMRSWSVRAESPATKATTAPAPAKESQLVRPPDRSTPNQLPVRPAQPSPLHNPGPVKKPAPANVAAPASSSAPAPSPGRSASVQPKSRLSLGKVLWPTTLGVASLAFAYGVSRPTPILRVFASTTAECRKVLAHVYDQASLIAQDRSQPPEGTEPETGEGADRAAAFPPLRVHAATSSAPRAIPARRSPASAQVPTSAPEVIQASGNPEPALVRAVARTVQIPDSIRRAQPEADSGRTVLGQLEPITLPEDAAEQMLSQKIQPSYPEQALKAGLQGAVVLQAWIGADGNIRELKLVRGSLLLGQAAYKAVKQWRYKPYLLNGRAVEAQTYVTVTFRLPQQSLLLPAGQ